MRSMAVAALVTLVACEGSVNCRDEVCAECCLNGECATSDECAQATGAATVLYCDGPEDCAAGEACCAGIPASSYPLIASCTAASECSMLPSTLYLCHEQADCGTAETCEEFFDDYASVCTSPF